MNRVALVLRTPAVALLEFDHPPGTTHEDPEHEVSPSHSINFVEGGEFDVRVKGRRWRFGPGSILVAEKGMSFSCSHDHEAPTDRCLTVSFADDTVEDLRRADVLALRPPASSVGPRQRFLRHRLRSCGAGEEMRLELLAGALYESLSDDARPLHVRAEGRVTPLMRRIDRAIEFIESRFARPLTLVDVANAAGLSTFHFARAFRDLTGLPPHRYLTAVRLQHAVRMLLHGASVTSTCYESGFGSLSHFVTLFRKRFGVTPSAARRGARVASLRAALREPVWKRA